MLKLDLSHLADDEGTHVTARVPFASRKSFFRIELSWYLSAIQQTRIRTRRGEHRQRTHPYGMSADSSLDFIGKSPLFLPDPSARSGLEQHRELVRIPQLTLGKPHVAQSCLQSSESPAKRVSLTRACISS